MACVGAHAAVRVQAATLALPGVELAGVSIDASLAADGKPTLRLKAAKVSVPALGWRDVAVTLSGAPQRAHAGAWKFVGHVATQRAPGNALGNANLTVLYDPGGGTLEVDIVDGKSRVEALLPLDQTSHVQMKLAGLPLTWLRGVLAAAWPDGRIAAGTVAGDVALDMAPGDTRVSGRVAVSGADLDSKSGTIAARGLGADGAFRIDTGVATGVLFDGRLQGGQLLAGPLYAALPKYPVGVHVSGSIGPSGIAIDSLDFDDPDALRVSGSVGFGPRGKLERLQLSRFAATFPAAYIRYGATLVQNLTGFQSLATSGSISGSVDFDDKGPQAIELTANNVALDDADGSLAIDGLDGSVDWRAGVSRPATRLKWTGLSMYRLALGPASLGLEDAHGTLQLRAPASAALFGGAIRIDRFAWRPGAGKGQRVSAALSASDVDMNQLCAALGWPAFGGKLGGAVPDVRYSGGDLVFGGGLSLNVFDGSVSVTDLSLKHPFGKTPELEANIGMRQLDLAKLTGAFGFGQITGRLDGDIDGLTLADWKPVAFSANLTATGGGTISQDAIKTLTEVGGGGIAGGIQGMALRLFKTFHYAKIGLSCTLAHGVCTMGGIVPEPDPGISGYTMVEGSGLPRITVIGHQRAVDWVTLVDRLKAATEGGAPVVR